MKPSNQSSCQLPGETFKEYRCVCGKLLFKSPMFSGSIEIKCRRCGRVRLFSAPPAEKIGLAMAK